LSIISTEPSSPPFRLSKARIAWPVCGSLRSQIAASATLGMVAAIAGALLVLTAYRLDSDQAD